VTQFFYGLRKGLESVTLPQVRCNIDVTSTTFDPPPVKVPFRRSKLNHLFGKVIEIKDVNLTLGKDSLNVNLKVKLAIGSYGIDEASWSIDAMRITNPFTAIATGPNKVLKGTMEIGCQFREYHNWGFSGGE
jgi:hypothetical protein